jgi:hypothetical protein
MLYSSSIRSLYGINIHVYEYLYYFMREAQQTPRQTQASGNIYAIRPYASFAVTKILPSNRR